MEIRKTYGGSDSRRLLPEKVEFAGVSGDNETATLIFEFPETYADYDKYIEWNIEIPSPDSKKTFKPLYLLTDDSFVIPRRLTKVCNGLDVDFNLVFVKDNTLIEKSLQSTVHFATSANGDATDDETDETSSLYMLITNAHIKAEYSENDVSYRPQITFTALDGSTQTLTLNMPYLNDAGKIPDYFLDKVFVVEIFSIASVNDLISLTEARKSDWAITPEQDLYLLTGEDYSISSNWLKVYSHDPTYNSITISNKSTTGSLEVLGNTRLIGDLEVDGNVVLNDDARVKGDLVVEGSINTVIDVHASNDLSSGRDTSVGGDLSVEGNARIKGDLDVDGSIDTVINVNAQTDLTAGQDVMAGRNLEVEGESLLKGNVSAEADVGIAGDLNVSEDASITGHATTGTLEALGDVLMRGDAEVIGDLKVNGSINTVIDVHASNDLSSGRDTTVGRNLQVDGSGRIEGDLVVVGSIDTVINVNAQTNLTAGQDVKAGRNIEVEGTSLLKGDVTALSNVNVSGDVLIEGNTEIKGDLDVDGSIDTVINVNAQTDLTAGQDLKAGRNLEIEGESLLKGDVTAKSDVLIEGDLDVYSNLNVSQDVSVTGSVTTGTLEALQDVLIGGNAEVGGDLLVNGSINTVIDVHASNDLSSARDTTVGRDLRVDGNASVGGDLLVEGSINTVINVNAQNDLTSVRDVKSGRNLEVEGTTLLKGDVTALSGVNITGDVLIGGNTEIKGDLDVDGSIDTVIDVHASNDLSSGRDVSVGRDLQVEGNARVKGDLDVDGSIDTVINVNAQTDLTAGQDLKATRNLEIGGTSILKGDVLIESDLQVDGDINTLLGGNSPVVTDANGKLTVANISVSDLENLTGIEGNVQLQIDTKEDKINKVNSWAGTPSDVSYPSEKLVKSSLDTKVDKNTAITSDTKCKVTYDAKGLVTGGADLADTDVPPLSTSKIVGLDTTLSEINTTLGTKVDKNDTIVGATKAKITYDSKGLVTAGADLVASDIPNLNASKINAGTLGVDRIPNISANKITSDTLADARIPSNIERNTNKIQDIQSTIGYAGSDTDYPSVHAVQKYTSGVSTPILEAISDLQDDKADDDKVVHKAGNETITGIKSFENNVNIGTSSAPKNLVLNGDLTIEGDIVQNGSSYETHAEKVFTANDKITLRDGAVSGLVPGTTAGFLAKLYDGYTDGEMALDSSGTIRVGDVGDTQPVLTRKESENLSDAGLLAWDSTNVRAYTRVLSATDIPNLSATKITTGTLADARIPTSVERTANKRSSFQTTPTDTAYPSEKLVKTALDGKVDSNPTITAGTKCKITYDSKGLVTAGANLVASDIPALATSKITGLDTVLNGLSTDISNINTSLGGKVDSNSAITGATKCKITYDSKGLVTSGADLTATDIPNLATSKITSGTFADARIPALEISKITGLQTAIDSKITANTAITGATKCKITYDTKGLVTAGADLIASDIPALDTAKITTGTFVDARIPSLNASKITAGTFADARIPTTVERIANKVTAWQTTPTDTAYPTEKLVKDSLDAKATASDLSSHTSNTSNPHSVTKAQVGLSAVANELQYSASNPPPYPVTSVAGKTGAVVLAEADIPALSAGKITSGTFADARIPNLNGSKITAGTVADARLPTTVERTSNKKSAWQTTPTDTAYPTEKLVKDTIDAHTGNTSNPHSVTKAQVGLTNVANVLQYSASNAPPYPVTSVAGKTGAVTLAEADIPALSAGKITSGTFDGARIPNLNASKVTAGTFVDARIPTSVERTANKKSAWQTTPTDTAYPTEKLVKDSLDAKADGADLTAHTGNTANPHSVTKAQVGLSNVANVLQYSASNAPPYPVTSVAGKTGAVVLAEADIPALGAGKITSGTFADARIPALSISKITNLQTTLDGKVASNTAITAGTKTKITYDAKGLVTAGASLAESDIPSLSAGKITSGTFDGARIPNLNASKVTAGTFADARIPALAISKITGLQTALDSKLNTTLKGAVNGLAELDANGKVPSTQLPSYVDDVLEYANLASFPVTGESGKIYIAIDDNKTYRWSGSTYTEISPSLALGETSATAYRGDRGATAFAHVTKTDNPHGVTKTQVGLGNVANVLQYSASNAPPYPVTSVAGKTGAVTLAEADIPALSAGKITSGTFSGARIPALAISKITNLQTTLDGKQTKGDGLHNAEASFYNSANTDLLHVDINNPTNPVNVVSHVGTEDASTLINSPISSGAFYAVRSVEYTSTRLTNANIKVLVTLKETYPIPGRVWMNSFNAIASSWSGWKSHNTGGWVTTWARDDNPSAYPNGLKSGIHNKSLFGGTISPYQRFRVLFYDSRTDMFSVVHCCSSGSNRVFSGPIVSSAEYMNNISAWFNAFHFENNGNDVYLQMKAVEVNQNFTWREDNTQAIWKIEKWVD